MNWEKARKREYFFGTIYFTRKDRRYKNLELYLSKSQDDGKGNRKRWLKKYSHKKVRLYKGELSNGGQYKKILDLQWILT